MSKTIEQKVVEMRFDNSNFEKNVSQSMSTLDKLQNAIDKTSSNNAFAGLSKAMDGLNFGTVTTAIQTVTEKFSLWEEIAIGAARNIGAALSNYVVKGLNDMVFSNVSAGWDKYAQKTEAVQTIMASIADQDFGDVDKMEYVTGILEKLNWFTDETSFHFTDMVSSIGKFTSAGVDLEKASDAMMGIATWAAVSGANANTASRVMYQLSQSLGMGSVRAQDWMSVETANMATKEFKELAISVAKAKGEITKSGKAKNGGKNAAVVDFKNFRETLKDGWLTSEVLNETLSQYSSAVEILNRTYYALGEDVSTSRILPLLEEAFNEAGKGGKKLEEVFTGLIEEEWGDKLSEEFDLSILDENGKRIGSLADKVTALGIRAFRAGQEAKTFAEALGSVPDAASTVWMQIWEKVFGDYETAKVLWTDLANYLYDIFVQPLWKVWDVIDEWQSGDGRELLFGRGETGKVEDATGAFYIMFETIKNVESAFMKAFGEVFPFGGENLVKISRKIQDFAKRTRVAKENVEELTNKFKNFFQFFKDIIDSIDIFNQKSEDSLDIIGLIKYRFEDAFTRVHNVIERTGQLIKYVKDGIVEFFKALKFNGTAIQNFTDTAENLGAIGDDVAKALSPISLVFMKLGNFGKKAGTLISDLLAALSFIPKEITNILRNTNLISNGATALKNILEAVKDGFNSAFNASIFYDIRGMFDYVWAAIKTFIDGFSSNFNIYDKIKTIAKGIGSAVNLVGRAINFLLTPIKVLTEMGIFTELGKFFGGPFLNALMSIPAAIGKVITKIDEFIDTHPRVQDVFKGIITIFSSIVRFSFSAINSISKFIEKTKPLAKVSTWVKNLFNKFKESEVVVNIGDKISEAFDKIVKFFNEDLTIENFMKKIEEAKQKVKEFVDNSETLSNVKTWFDNVTASIKKFVDESEFLSNFKKNIEELWKNFKTLFSGEDTFEGFGADFVGGFVKGVFNAAKNAFTAIKEFGSKVLETFRDILGIHSPSEETEDDGNNFVMGFVKGVINAIKKAVEAVKKFAGSVFGALNESFFGKEAKPFVSNLNDTEEVADGTSSFMDNIKGSLGKFAKSLLGVGAIALPTVAITKLANGFRALMSPFEALERALTIAEWKVKGEVIVNGITALGGMLKTVLLSIGGLVLMFVAAGAILAVAKKYTAGANGEDNLIGPMIAMIGMIGEVLSLVGTTAVTLAKIGGKSSIRAGGSLKHLGGSFKQNVNETASWIMAIGDIFVKLGEAMLMFSAAVAIMAFASKQFGKDTVKDVMIYFGIFTLVLGIAGALIAKFGGGETSTKAGLSWKKGINFEHNGYTEGLYAIGVFMLSVGTAMAAMALAAAIVIKAANGDVDLVNAAFQGMMGIMFLALTALVGIAIIQQKMPAGEITKTSSAIKDASIALAAMSLSIRVIAKAVIMLGKEDPNKLKQGVRVIGEIGVIVFAFAFLTAQANESQMKNASKVGLMMLEMAAAFAIIGMVIKQLGEMDSTKLDKALKAFATFAMFFGVISSLSLLAATINTSDNKFGLIGFMLMEIATSLVVVAGAIKILDSVDNMGKSLLGLGASFLALGLMFGAITIVSAKLKNINAKEIAGMSASLILISAAFVVMGKAINVLGSVGNLDSAVGGLIASFVALGLLFALVSGMAVLNEGKGSEIVKSAAGLALVAAAMAVLMKIVAEVGTTFVQNDGALGKGVLALAAVLGVLTAVAVIASFAAPAMLTFGKGIAALGIGMLALAAGFFIFYQVLVLLSAEAAMFGGAVSDMVEGFLDRFIALGPKLTAAITMIFKAIIDSIVDLAEDIVKAIIEIMKVVSENLDQILNLLGPILDKLLVFIVEKCTLLITLLQPLVENIITHILYLVTKMLVPGLLTAVQLIVNFIMLNVPLLARMVVSTVEMIVTRLLELIDFLINSEAGILAIISRALMGENGILTIVDTFLHLLLESLRGLTTDLVDTIVYIIQELVDGIIDNIDIILTGVEDAINMVVDHIVSLTDTVLQGVVDVIEGIATAIDNHGSDIWKAIWHVITAIWNSFWGIFDGDGENSISSLASKFMQGLGDGLKNFVGKVTGAISWVVGKIFGKFEEEAEIHSPSKVMAKMGEYLDLGLAEGIADASGSPINAISGLGGGIIDSLKSTFLGDDAGDITGMFGDNITDALSGSLGNMSDLLNTDDFTPTITPVLDLSEIQNGASQIPGMINSGSGYTVDTTAVVRGAYDPYQYYDGTERVSTSEAQMDYFEALKTKMDEVVAKFGNAKVVLDTGAVVGGIVDPMDMALGQRMAQVGRGVIASSR